MSRISAKAKTLWDVARQGQITVAAAELRKWLWSDTAAFGLVRDLTKPFAAPDAVLPIHVRPLEPGDEPKLFSDVLAGAGAASDPSAYLLRNRRAFLRERVPTCYVAVTQDDEPCYMQWLIGPESNEKIQRYFQGIFPRLASHERLLEYAFTVPSFQGKRIMAAAMARVAAQGIASGATRAITFVEADNVAALKGCQRAGFAPYVKRVTSWRLMRRSVRFEPLASDDGGPQRSGRDLAADRANSGPRTWT